VAREQRKLAAILAADVVGYSRLMGRDESGTFAAMKALRQKVVDPAIAGLTISCRRLFSAASVPLSSLPISRE
jgi:class 3 adenylate cyclase